jgi:ankyrin repeat protein
MHRVVVDALAIEAGNKLCLDSLFFSQIDARLLNIKKAHDRTCDWLFGQPEYKKWLHSDLTEEYHGFLWIRGKPAAGKSTIMKHALFRTKELLAGAVIISFFFNARGSDLEKTTLGMYRSLLYQLLIAIPALQDSIVPQFLLREKDKDDEVYEWDIEGLQESFITAVRGLHQQRLVCFIDALDECEENDVRAMVEFLEDLGSIAVSSKTFLNICLSSRHYPHISMRNGLQLTVERQDGHEKDIAAYVQSKFKAPCTRQTDEIRAEILRRASGVFLWVVLVVQMLNKAYDHGQIHALWSRLKEIPDELDDLFADILMRDDVSRDETVLCLQWLLFAQRLLRREELYFAVRSGTLPIEPVKWDPSEISYETIERFILSCSKGLAEVSRESGGVVQFIHESVRDFFLFRNGLTKLQPDLAGDVHGLTHERLKICCDQYLMTGAVEQLFTNRQRSTSLNYGPGLQEATSAKLPFLAYAANNIFRHADAAQGHGFSQRTFLREFVTPNNFKLRKLIDILNISHGWVDDSTLYYTPNAKLLYILSVENLSNLVQVLLDDQVDVDAKGEFYGTAIQAAAAHGNEKVVQLLLGAGANVNIPGGKFGHTLNAAFAKRNEAIIQMLLDKSRIPTQNVLDEAVCKSEIWGNAFILCFLLDKGANPNCRNENGETLLEFAVRNPVRNKHEAVVQLLFRKGAGLNLSQDDKNKLLLSARSVDITQILLHNGADQFATDDEGRTLLSLAALERNEAIMRLLLANYEANPSRMAEDIQLALAYAISKEHTLFVEMLEKVYKRLIARLLDKAYEGRT